MQGMLWVCVWKTVCKDPCTAGDSAKPGTALLEGLVPWDDEQIISPEIPPPKTPKRREAKPHPG